MYKYREAFIDVKGLGYTEIHATQENGDITMIRARPAWRDNSDSARWYLYNTLTQEQRDTMKKHMQIVFSR